MSESNKTHSDQTHRIFISSLKPTVDRTGLYILGLLCFLVFILIFYLVYNFISYKRYSSVRKKNKTKSSSSIGTKLKNYSDLYEELIIPSYEIPLKTSQLASDL